ncbi:MAG TPA: hypothetical protein VKU84_06380 [Stellaceae bacterium]|nr:hypothetical protein [Stellaceae bacterium]
MVDLVADKAVSITSAAGSRSASAVSWASIVGGAVAAAAVSVILLALGSGVGFSAISAWPGNRVSATTFGMTGAVWLVVTQWLSSALGGYLSGRLRTKAVGVHTDEVFFRDTAHGFLAWALSTLIGVALLGAAMSVAITETARNASVVAAGVSGGIAQGSGQQGAAGAPNVLGYLTDTLFRSPNPSNDAQADPRAETMRLLTVDLRNGDVPDTDKAYLAQLVSARTGLSQADAEARVNQVVDKAKAAMATARQEADAARRAAANGAFFTAFALVIGAFIAAAAGALGGHHRDEF